MRNRPILLLISLLSVGTLFGCGVSPSSSGGGGTSGEVVIGDYYTITFNYNDSSSRPFKKEVEKGSPLDSTPNPIREGYQFDGWYTALEGGEKVSFPYTATSNVTLYAHWSAAKFDVTFDYNYEGAPSPYVVKIEYNQTVNAPADVPTRENYVFRYWAVDQAGEEAASFPYLIREDAHFYASWRDVDVVVYTVNVHFGDYDEAPEDLVFEVEEGDSVTRAMIGDNPSRSGYTFMGWSLSEGGELITLPFTPTEDATIYAVWERVSYTLKFQYNYTDSPAATFETTTFYAGEDIAAPKTDPTRENYTFVGWYTAEKGGTKVTFPTKAYRNLTYYAHWEHLAVTTDMLQAEYCYFDPNFNYPGYSGAAKGDQCVIPVAPGFDCYVDNYPTNSMTIAGKAYAVSYQYSNDAVLEFKFEASEDISSAVLSINWSSEFDEEFGPDESSTTYVIEVNGTAVNYDPVFLESNRNEGGQPVIEPGPFLLCDLGTVSLNQGSNTVRMHPNNSVVHGTMTATAPVIDYISFTYEGTGKISWKPVYLNIEGK